MPKICDKCKTTGGFLKDSTFINFKGMELCNDCADELIKKIDKEVIITGSETIEGYKIIEYIDVASTETIIGVGMFMEMVGKATDYFENKSSMIEKNIQKTRNALTKRLKSIAYEKDGNAIIKFRLEYEGISANRMVVIASGTVVKVEKNNT